MTGSLTIIVRYPDGSKETFTGCVLDSGSTDSVLKFTGQLQGDAGSTTGDAHTIPLGPGMRVTKRIV